MRGLCIGVSVGANLLMSALFWGVAVFKDGAPISAIGIAVLTLWLCVGVAGVAAVFQGPAIGGSQP